LNPKSELASTLIYFRIDCPPLASLQGMEGGRIPNSEFILFYPGEEFNKAGGISLIPIGAMPGGK